MKYLNEIKLSIGLALVIFGMYFGYLINKELGSTNALGGTAFIGTGSGLNLLATYTPFYAGICICAGVYLIGKIK